MIETVIEMGIAIEIETETETAITIADRVNAATIPSIGIATTIEIEIGIRISDLDHDLLALHRVKEINDEEAILLFQVRPSLVLLQGTFNQPQSLLLWLITHFLFSAARQAELARLKEIYGPSPTGPTAAGPTLRGPSVTEQETLVIGRRY